MGPYVPPGQSPPFQVVDELHHGAWVIITVALGLVFSVVSFLIRLYVRLALHPPFTYDDFVLLGATIIAAVQSSSLFSAVSYGFGTSIGLLSADQVHKIQTLIVVSDVLYLITLYTTKCCVIGIYLRLTPQKGHNRASWATLVLCTLWVIPAVLIITINCHLNRPWRGPEGQCLSLLARWQFIVALDITTELIIFGLAITLLAGLFMPLKRKVTIGLAFVFRLPMILFAIFHIWSLHRNIGSGDPTLAAVRPVIWAQVELHYALIACSVFCLRPFMAAVSTNYGTAGDSTLESSHGSRTTGHTHSGSKSASGSGSRSRGALLVDNETGILGHSQPHMGTNKLQPASNPRDTLILPDPSSAHAIELVENGRGGSIGSDGSAKMIILKDVQYSVEYNGLESDPGPRGGGGETEYWDRYLEAQR